MGMRLKTNESKIKLEKFDLSEYKRLRNKLNNVNILINFQMIEKTTFEETKKLRLRTYLLNQNIKDMLKNKNNGLNLDYNFTELKRTYEEYIDKLIELELINDYERDMEQDIFKEVLIEIQNDNITYQLEELKDKLKSIEFDNNNELEISIKNKILSKQNELKRKYKRKLEVINNLNEEMKSNYIERGKEIRKRNIDLGEFSND